MAGFEGGLFINFSRATFFVFMSTQMVDMYVFDLSAHKTNLMKKRSVTKPIQFVSLVTTPESKNPKAYSLMSFLF